MWKRKFIHLLLMVLCISLIVSIVSIANANNPAAHRIQLLNKYQDQKFVFSEEIIKISVGDEVTFEPTTKGHNVVSIKGLLPNNAKPIKTAFNKEATIAFTVPGVYGIKCSPHVGAGMIALIIVGEPSIEGIDTSKVKLPKKAKLKLKNLVSQL